MVEIKFHRQYFQAIFFLLVNAFLSVFKYLKVGKIFILKSLNLCSESHDNEKPRFNGLSPGTCFTFRPEHFSGEFV